MDYAMSSDSQNSFRPTDRSLPIALLRAREKVMEPVREILAHSNISEQKWRVLRVVDEAGPVEPIQAFLGSEPHRPAQINCDNHKKGSQNHRETRR